MTRPHRRASISPLALDRVELDALRGRTWAKETSDGIDPAGVQSKS
jgi:hypothetical protein